MTDEEFVLAEEILLKEFETSIAKQKGVKLPTKKENGNHTKNWNTLVYLFWNEKTVITKQELTEFLSKKHGTINDVQQARHLSNNNGFHIKQYRDEYRGEILKKGQYVFLGFNSVDPQFDFNRRQEVDLDWSGIKQKFSFCCATCGSEENEKHRYTKEIVFLEKGHKDPRKPMTNDNIIPQCSYCNKKYKDKVIFDDYGQVYKVLTRDMLDDSI